MSFAERQITITITLQSRQGSQSFGDAGVAANANPTFTGSVGGVAVPPNSNTIKLTGGGKASQNGLRISAKIARPGATSYGTASVQIYNLPLTLMNQLSTLGTSEIYLVGNNHITIEAGSVGGQSTVVYDGNIYDAYADFSGMPDVVFNITSQAGPFAIQGAVPAPATGYNGPKSSATLLGNIASQVGYTLVNNFQNGAAPVQLSNQYLSGSFRKQIMDIARNANFSLSIDDVKKQFIIYPKNGTTTLPGAPIPIIGPPPIGNMVGYPSYTNRGLKIKNEFSTEIGYGATVQVKGSQLINANGTWIVYYLDYDLEVQAPDGPWFTNLELGAPGMTPVLSPQAAAP